MCTKTYLLGWLLVRLLVALGCTVTLGSSIGLQQLHHVNS